MTELIPYFILEKNAEEKTSGAFEGYCLFIDIVGFTKLTARLMAKGTLGAEQLSNTLNKLFGPLVDHVYERGGFIPYFAGDAFLAFFEKEQNEENLHNCLSLISDIQTYFLNTDDSDIEDIAIKVGMSYGTIEWGLCGSTKENKTFYFRGEAIESATKAQQHAQGGEVILQSNLVAEKVTWLKNLEGELYSKLVEFPSSMNVQVLTKPKQKIDLSQTVEFFLPNNVINYNLKGEYREVTSVFISFKGVDDCQSAGAFFSKVRSLCRSFSGYFKEIDFSDKGGVIVVLFGAPVSFENNVERALEFTLALKEEQASGAFDSNLAFKAGVSTGMCFTGMLGGEYKKQYVALGTHVNLAARLMSYANWGLVAVTQEVAQDENFVFEPKGDVHFKGISNAVSTYTLKAKSNNGNQFSGHFIGREEEKTSISDFLRTHTVKENKPTFVKIFGEAGIGKSRLMHEIEMEVVKHDNVRWHTCQADQILRKPFNPIIFFLRDYFDQNPKHTPQQNKENFESRLDFFVEEFKAESDTYNAEELMRFKPVYNALLGFDTRKTLWEELDAKARFNAIIDSVVYIFKTISRTEKLIVEFEDLHWFDESTMTFLKRLVEKVDSSPIAIVCTSRYFDDGSKPIIIDNDFLIDEGFLCKEIDLNQLSDASIQAYTENKLEGKAEAPFLKFLSRTTNGNPFYLEQILAYLVESALLKEEQNIWSIKDEDISVSSSINSILMARVDRLSEQVKETVKTAAVIGREFEIPVLTEVMRDNQVFQDSKEKTTILREQIIAAEKGQIWSAINELKYIFKHSLLREAVYNMQLKSNLRELHLLIGEAIEHLYMDSLATRYVDLAFHFEEAQRHTKAMFYMKKAADNSRKNFENKQALRYYAKMKAYLDPERDLEEYAKVLLRESEVLELVGQWTESLEILRKASAYAEKTGNQILIGRTKNQLGKLLVLKGDYAEAKVALQSAIEIFTNFNDDIGLFKAQGNLGDLYFRQAEYDDARNYFEKSISLAKDFKDTFTVTQIVSNLGLTYMNQSLYQEAIRCQKDQLALCEKRGDRNGMAILNTNIGIVYSELNKIEEAFPYYEIGYKLSHELGNKQMEAIATGCLGHIYHERGNYSKALELYTTDQKLCKELGDKRGLAIINGLIAELLISSGDFAKAKEHLASQLSYSLELQYQKGITKAYLTIGQVHFYREQFDKALENFEKSINLAEKIKYFPSKEEGCIWKIDVLLNTGKLEEAKKTIQHLEAFEELEDRHALGIRKAEILAQSGQIQEAETSIYKQLPDIKHPKNLARAHYVLAKFDLNKKAESLKVLRALYTKMPDYEIKIKIDELV